MFCAQNYHKSAVVTLKWAKIGDLGAKIAHFLLNAQNASICIRMHQNVCRMNCANVLCTKLSKKWFLLDLKGLKLKNYLWLFVMEDPVCKESRKVSSKKNIRSIWLERPEIQCKCHKGSP